MGGEIESVGDRAEAHFVMLPKYEEHQILGIGETHRRKEWPKHTRHRIVSGVERKAELGVEATCGLQSVWS